MTRPFSIVASVCLIVLTGALLWMASAAVDALNAWETAGYRAADTMSLATPAIQNVNRATDIWATASQKQADAADAILKDIRVETWQLDRTFLKVNSTLDSYSTLPGHLNKTADAATQLTDTLSGRLPGTLDRVDALVADSDASVRQFNTLLASKDLADGLHHGVQVTAHLDEISADTAYKFHQWAHPDKRTGIKGFFWGLTYWLHRLEPPIL